MNKSQAKRQGTAIAEAIRIQTFKCGGEAHVLVGSVTGNPRLPLPVNLALMRKLKRRLQKRYPSIVMVLVVNNGLVHAHIILWTEQDVRTGLSHPLLWALSEARDRIRENSKDRKEIESQLKQEFRSNRALMAARLHFRREKEALQLGWMWTLEPVLKNIEAVAFYTCRNYIQGAAWKSNAPENCRRTNIYLRSGIPKGVKPRWQDIGLLTAGPTRHRRAMRLIGNFFQVGSDDFRALDQITGWDKHYANHFANQICRRLGADADAVLSAGYARWEGYEILADLLLDASVIESYGQQGGAAELVDHTRDRELAWIEANLVPVGHGGGAANQAADATVPPEGCQGDQMQGEAAA